MYAAGLGRFLSRDPIGYQGSRRNLSQYVTSSPTRFIDPTGTVEWIIVEEPNYHFTTTVVTVRDPEIVQEMGPTTDGQTQPRLDLSFKCTCKRELFGIAIPGSGGWVLSDEGIKITFFVDVYIRPGLPADRLRWAKLCEQDHVNDLLAWAGGPGQQAAARIERELLAMDGTWTLEACGTFVRDRVLEVVGPSLVAAMRASVGRWDTSGLHDWENPNRSHWPLPN